MKKEFQISSAIYDFAKVSESVGDFSQVAEMQFVDGVLSITGKSENEIQEVFNELMNYNIGLING